jgi:hypothetical protein
MLSLLEQQPSCLSVKCTKATSWWPLAQTCTLPLTRNEPPAVNTCCSPYVVITRFQYMPFICIKQPVVTRLRTGRPTTHGSIPDRSKGFFSSPKRTGRLGVQPSPLSSRCRGRFPGLMRRKREADHSPPSSAEVKNDWGYASNPHTLSWRVKDNFALFWNFISMYLHNGLTSR